MSPSARRNAIHSPDQQDKVAARRRALTRRWSRPPVDDAERIALARAVLALPEVRRARTVAAYVSVGREPPTDRLLDALKDRGAAVLLPVLRPDADLDWAAYTGASRLVDAGRGLREPAGPRLGRGAVASADVLIVPGLAAGADGMRLGRGGGSYDRVLARVGGAVPAVLLLWDGELVSRVPAEPHDRPVSVVVTPTGVRRFAPAG